MDQSSKERTMRHSLLPTLLTLACFCLGPALNNDGAVSASGPVRPTKVITLERTVCFGTCPHYKLTIFSDGLVSYEGIEYVKKVGRASGRISRAKLNDLVKEFIDIDYFNLANSYTPGDKACPEDWTDMPSANTSLTWRGRSKAINHYHGCRGSSALELLTKLEDKIDEAVNVKKWTK
jgi:hypothetical protein